MTDTIVVGVDWPSSQFGMAFGFSDAAFTLRGYVVDFDSSAATLGVHPVSVARYVGATITAPGGGGGAALDPFRFAYPNVGASTFTGFADGPTSSVGISGTSAGVMPLRIWNPANDGHLEVQLPGAGLLVPAGGALSFSAYGNTDAEGGTHVSPSYICTIQLFLDEV